MRTWPALVKAVAMKAEFIKSCLKLEDCPASKLPEVAILGRSNAGKSSLVNAWTGRKSLAFVSQEPGHTQTLNFFLIDEKFILTDLPGYGFAKLGKKTQENWTPYIETYLAERENLKGVILIHDIFRDWSRDEANLTDWLGSYGRRVVIALNKVDKLNQKELAARLKVLNPHIHPWPVALISAKTRKGIDEFNRTVFDNLIRS